MLKSLNEEDQNSDNFSECCLNFYFQPARPWSDGLKAKMHFQTHCQTFHSRSRCLLVIPQKIPTIHFFSGSDLLLSDVVQLTHDSNGCFLCGWLYSPYKTTLLEF